MSVVSRTFARESWKQRCVEDRIVAFCVTTSSVTCKHLQRESATKRHNAEMAEMLIAMKNVQKTVSDYHVKLFRSLGEMSAPSFAAAAANESMGF
jgi:hypothetical protein